MGLGKLPAVKYSTIAPSPSTQDTALINRIKNRSLSSRLIVPGRFMATLG
jgi:hypothetical protein